MFNPTLQSFGFGLGIPRSYGHYRSADREATTKQSLVLDWALMLVFQVIIVDFLEILVEFVVKISEIELVIKSMVDFGSDRHLTFLENFAPAIGHVHRLAFVNKDERSSRIVSHHDDCGPTVQEDWPNLTRNHQPDIPETKLSSGGLVASTSPANIKGAGTQKRLD